MSAAPIIGGSATSPLPRAGAGEDEIGFRFETSNRIAHGFPNGDR